MSWSSGSREISIAALAIFVAAPAIFGQDLGSSTSILKKGSSKTSSSKKTPRKTKTRRVSAPSRSSSGRKSKPAAAQPATATPVAAATPAAEVPKPVAAPERVVKETQPGVADAVAGAGERFELAIEEGNRQRNARNYDQAEAAYRRGVSINPDDYRAIYGLGNLYSDQQRWEEAETSYRSAIKLEPRSPNAYIALSFVLTQPVPGLNLMARYAEAETLARRAIELDMDDAVAYDQLGVSMELQGKIGDETLNQYRKAVALDPTFALAYAHLGRLLRRKGQIEESNQAYISSIQFSLDVPTMILVADVMQSQQRYADSEQLLRRALREDPKNPTALYLLGRALTTLGEFEEAQQVLLKSAEVSPRSFVSYTLLGSLYLRQREFGRAEQYLEEARKVVSPNEQKRLAIEFEAVGDGYLSAGKKADALRVYKAAAALGSQTTELKNKISRTQP